MNRRWKIRLVVLAVVVVTFAAYRFTLQRSLDAQLNFLRRRGYPISFSELASLYPGLPARENAADVYQQAFTLYVTWPSKKMNDVLFEGSAKTPARGQPTPQGILQACTEYLATNAEALAILHQAAGMKQCRWATQITETNLFAKLLPNFSGIRKATRLLSLEATLAAEDGDTQRATSALVAGVGAARSLEQEPLLIEHLVRVACADITINMTERILSRASLTDPQVAELSQAFAAMDANHGDSMVRGLTGELAFVNQLLVTPLEQNLNSSQDEQPSALRKIPFRLLTFLIKASGLRDLDYTAYLNLMERLIATEKLPYPQKMKSAREIEAQAARLPRYCLMTRQMIPMFISVVEKDVRTKARMMCGRTALAVERYRLANGTLPDRLAALVPAYLPAMPIDPFDGQPLRYTKRPTGYVVYSIGADGQDNGGKDRDDCGLMYGPGSDIAFTVER